MLDDWLSCRLISLMELESSSVAAEMVWTLPVAWLAACDTMEERLTELPALVAIATKAAISALQGNVMPQLISIPIPVATYKTLKAGENFWPDLKANFFAPNQFLPCGVTFTAPEIMAQSEKNTQ